MPAFSLPRETRDVVPELCENRGMFPCRTLSMSVLCALAMPAHAQSVDDGSSNVSSKPQSSAQQLDTIRIVGAQRPLSALPGSASVLDADEIREGQRQVNLSESLQRVPGFTALDRQNYAQDLQIQSRGFGARSTFGIRGIRLIVDGIPASAADGQAQAAAFPLSSLDRIEVLRGPLALQYGNAAGGVILGISELDDTSGISAEAWAGSDGSQRAAVGIDGSEDAWRWRASASAFATDGARPHSAARRNQFNAIGEWSRREGERLRVVYNGLRQPLAEDPLGLTREAFDLDPAGTDPTAKLFDTRKTVREDQLGLRWQYDDASGGERWLSAYRVERAIEQFLAVPVVAQRAPGSAGGVIDLGRGSHGIDLGRRWVHARGSVALGIEAARLDEARRGYENFVGQRLGVRGRLRRDERNRIDTLDLYASADYRFVEDWTVLLGVRRASLRFDSNDRYLVNGDDSGGRRDAGIAWSFGAVRAFAQGEVYASLGHGFETPTLNERAYRPDGAAGFNRDLRTAGLRSLEVGARWRGAWGDASLSAYRVDGEDEIVPALSRGGRASFANAGTTRRDGIEFGASGDVGAQWRYALAASWIDARFVDGYTFAVASGTQIETRVVAAGNRIPGVPRADVFAEWAWRSDDARWSSALEGRWLGEIATDDRNTDAAPAHARFAWRGQWRARRDAGWYAFLRIDNLFDRRFAGSVIVNEANGRYFEPGSARSVTLAIGWSGRR
jgi:iron complex outermembrane receptor protein